jgi:hypothetical protein
VKWVRIVEAIGLVRERGGMLGNIMPTSRWARSRLLSVGGENLSDMIDSVGQWEYVVEMVCMWALAMWPLYPGEFMTLWR